MSNRHHVSEQFDVQTVERAVERAPHGVVLGGHAAATLARFAPELVAQLLTYCPIAVIDGAIDLPITKAVQNAKVDLITIDTHEIAARVVRDIISDDALRTEELVRYEATASFDVCVRDSSTNSRRRVFRLPLCPI